MAKEKELWDAVTAPSAAKRLVAWDRRTIQYPIGIESTLLASSHDWVGLQLADLVAGAITRTMKSLLRGGLEHDPYAADVLRAIREWRCLGSLWPSDEIDPEQLGTVGPAYDDPIEYIETIKRRIGHHA